MTVEKYSNRSIWIHWLSAILMLVMIPTGLAMSETEATSIRLSWYKIHFITGILVFILAVFHVYVYFKDERPTAVNTGNDLQNKCVAILHRLLTIFIIVLTITGVASVCTTQIWTAIINNDYKLLSVLYDSVFVTMHHIQGLIFIILIMLHIVGIFLHRAKIDPTILQRMGLKL